MMKLYESNRRYHCCNFIFAMAEETTLSHYGLGFSSAALTPDYRFRGMTQTESDPAVQGGFASFFFWFIRWCMGI